MNALPLVAIDVANARLAERRAGASRERLAHTPRRRERTSR